MTASETEMSTNDQVVCMEIGETSSAVFQYVGDNIDLNIVCVHGNTPFHWVVWTKFTALRYHCQIHRQQLLSVPRVKLKVLDKAKILRGPEVKNLPFTKANRQEYTLSCFCQLLSSPPIWLMTSHSSLRVTHSWQRGGWSKPRIVSSHTLAGMAGWRESMQMIQSRAHRSTSSQSLKVTLMTSTLSLPLTFKEWIRPSADSHYSDLWSSDMAEGCGCYKTDKSTHHCKAGWISHAEVLSLING